MAVGYRAVQWNSAKRWIDLGLILFVFVAIGGYIVATGMTHPRIPGGPLIYRGTAIAAFALLSINLAIGPLARMDRRFAPLLPFERGGEEGQKKTGLTCVAYATRFRR